MSVYDKYLREASRTFKIADHMVSVTYPLVKDTKLLLAVLENLNLTLKNSIAALVYYDRHYKRLPPFQDSFESQFNVFRAKSVERYKIDKSYITLIQNIESLIKDHKASPMEFIRKDKFVIFSDNYNIKTFSLENIREYVSKIKEFKDKICLIIKENERISP